MLSPAIDGIRLSLHVLAAAVWVGGQLTLAELVPTVRKLSPEATKLAARAFARLSWPAFAIHVYQPFEIDPILAALAGNKQLKNGWFD